VQFDATLEVTEPVGNEVFLNLRFGKLGLVARVPPRPLPASGATLRMAFDPSRLHAFDGIDGHRVV
jgi:multiple sugar transport system ATP-binding protein